MSSVYTKFNNPIIGLMFVTSLFTEPSLVTAQEANFSDNVVVVIDLYSGRENPSLVLGSDDVEAKSAIAEYVSRATASSKEYKKPSILDPNKLGYRGIPAGFQLGYLLDKRGFLLFKPQKLFP